LPKRNYQFEKRQKDLAKKQKQEDKAQRKLDRAQEAANAPDSGTAPDEPRADDAGEG